MFRTTRRPTCPAVRARTWRACPDFVPLASHRVSRLRGRSLRRLRQVRLLFRREIRQRPGTKVLALDHLPEQEDENACVEAEYNHVEPPRDLPVPRQHAPMEYP